MDLTWGGAKRMMDAAAAADIQLTFNHQRRFGAQFIGAKSLLDDGEIGPLQRIEIGVGNLYDFGSHTLDLAGKFVDQSPPAWVLGAIDYRDTDVRFGTHNENHASVTWAYDNGVHGALSTGVGSGVFDCFMRLVGRDGVLQIHHDRDPALRCRVDGEGWRDVDLDAVTNGHSDGDAGPLVTRAIRDVIDAIRDDRNSELRASNALQATALSFGAWESVRRDARVEDPLSMDIEDNPLEAMVESGRLTPE
jgi:predicted dehydrogenase